MGADAEAYADCGCHIGPWWGVTPPPQCAAHGGPSSATVRTVTGTTTVGTPVHVIDYGQHLQPTINNRPTVAVVATLTDQDVERIARRVAELLKAGA